MVAVIVLEERPFAGGGGEATFWILRGATSLEVGEKAGPIETEVRADAWIGGDAQIVREEELIDGRHERKVVGRN